MSDLLDLIAQQQEDIAQCWVQSIQALPNSPYLQLDGETLLASVRRSCQALLDVMRSGDTATMETMLRDSVRRRMTEGVAFSDSAAVWLLYRQAVHETVKERLKDVDAWEEMIDRVDGVLDWVLRVLRRAYQGQ